jgi:TolB-like protein
LQSLPGDISALSRDAILEHLAKVLSSPVFEGSIRSTQLLRFLVEQTISGQADRLKEYTLGTEALGKGASFDPRTDPIVRAEVSRLRNRLDKYYATAGQTDSLVITLSKGSYIPRFQNRTSPPTAGSEEFRPSRSGRPTWFAVGLGTALALFLAILWASWLVIPSGSAVSIAVLPFANVSTDPSQEFFSDGMTDEIAEALAKVPDLRIVARSSAYTFKNQNQQARAIGRALGATHLIEGSVRQAGNRVRITAQLIEAANGLQVWSQSYDRDLTDIFTIQEEIAEAIAGALRVPLGLQQGQHLVSNRIGDVNSYQQYLRAKAQVRGRQQKSLNDATALLELVVARDPDFAPAWALLAITYNLALTTNPARFGGSADEFRGVVDASRSRADAAARRAIQLDPKLADGYLALAVTQDRRGKFLLADEMYSKALLLDPYNPDSLHEYSHMLAGLGYLKQALAMRQELLALEPFVPVFNWSTAQIRWLNGQNDAAIAMFEALPPSAARAIFLANFYAATGRYGEAADAMMLIPSGMYPSGLVENAVQLMRTAPASAVSLQTLPRLSNLGFVYLYIGASSRALEFYEGDLDANYLVSAFTADLWNLSFAPLRKTERFKTFARKAGMVEYWHAKGWPDFCRPVGADDFVCS